jgi:hypothetical protein
MALTVWAFGRLRVKRASCLYTVALFDLSDIATDELMFLRKTSRNTKLVEPSLTPLVLLADPSALNEIPFARLNASTVGVIKMSLPPQDLSVGVASRMRNDTCSQKDGSKSLRELNHDDLRMLDGCGVAQVLYNAMPSSLLYLWRLARGCGTFCRSCHS